MTDWAWIDAKVVFAIHDRLIAEHGGVAGIRDRGAIEAALDRPRNLAAYGTPDIADLAAACACGLLRNHGFLDGNKRIAWMAARLFIALNGYAFSCNALDAVRMVEQAAARQSTEAEFAAWLRAQTTSL
ncbi:death-on-curing protein [Stella humosa]|uniref:Death-on-curing protein n=1 Tax=Stella humosa TaxID=94 RepID=A0A3N1LIQ4_9PROT|nr:type II toxin-antitoxin system death-on-curing family toxin [Stella humosa]ROP91170.1 death-on-curing protein [Stella humosa]BBK34478.1 death-on-curing protein [Stella humosa]